MLLPRLAALPLRPRYAYDAGRELEADMRVVRWIVAVGAVALLAGFFGGFVGALLAPRPRRPRVLA